jgi:tetratricopeptide (TPR) repeat protein
MTVAWNFQGFPHIADDADDRDANISLDESLRKWFRDCQEYAGERAEVTRSHHHDITSERIEHADLPSDPLLGFLSAGAAEQNGSRDRALQILSQDYLSLRDMIGVMLFGDTESSVRQKIRFWYVGGLLASKLLRWEEALEFFERVMGILAEQGPRDSRALALAYYQGGAAAFHSHHYRRAAQHFQNIIALEPALRQAAVKPIVTDDLESFLCDVALQCSQANFNLGYIEEARKFSLLSKDRLSDWLVKNAGQESISAEQPSATVIQEAPLFIGHVPDEILRRPSKNAWRQLAIAVPWEYAFVVQWAARFHPEHHASDLREHSYQTLQAGIHNLQLDPPAWQQLSHHFHMLSTDIALTGSEISKDPPTQSDWLLLAHDDREQAFSSLQQDDPHYQRHRLFLDLLYQEWRFRQSHVIKRTENYPHIVERVELLQRSAFEHNYLHISGRSHRLLGQILAEQEDPQQARDHFLRAHNDFELESDGIRYSPFHDEMKRKLKEPFP